MCIYLESRVSHVLGTNTGEERERERHVRGAGSGVACAGAAVGALVAGVLTARAPSSLISHRTASELKLDFGFLTSGLRYFP